MLELVLAVMGASVLGSLHCAGMCGGLVSFYAGAGSDRRQQSRAHVAYHGGRLVTYVVLGTIAGSAGAAIDLAGEHAGLGRLAAALAGGAMVVFGLGQLASIAGWRAPRPKVLLRLSLRSSALIARLTRWAPGGELRALAMGLASALLPCGWLYAFVLTAAGTGRPVAGGLVMAAFWVGTLPALLALGVMVQKLFGRARAFVPAATAVILVLVGSLTVSRRMELPSFAQPAAEQDVCHH